MRFPSSFTTDSFGDRALHPATQGEERVANVVLSVGGTGKSGQVLSAWH